MNRGITGGTIDNLDLSSISKIIAEGNRIMADLMADSANRPRNIEIEMQLRKFKRSVRIQPSLRNFGFGSSISGRMV
jgi:hypothetical protein